MDLSKLFAYLLQVTSENLFANSVLVQPMYSVEKLPRTF